MDCRTAQQLITDAVTGGLRDHERDALAAHCDGCAACRAELEALGEMWDRMGRSRVPAPAADLAERFGNRLAVEGRTAVRPWSSRWAVAAAVVLFLFGSVGGFAVGRWSATEQVPVSGPASPAYLLLLYGETEAPGLNTTQLIAEYARWAGELREEGRLIQADRLLGQVAMVEQGDDGAEIGPVRTAGADAVSGFFLIHADDLDSALQLALEGPHARYGGRVEVRPVAQ